MEDVTFMLMMSLDRTRLGAHANTPIGVETPQRCLFRAATGLAGVKQMEPEWLLREPGRYSLCTRVGIEFLEPLPDPVAVKLVERAAAELRAEGYQVNL